MLNFLEQFVAEWYELRGYFVRRNVKVDKRSNGGYNSELDVVAFNPEKRHLVHIEPSMDAGSWEHLEKRFTAKFVAGKRFIPDLFTGLDELPDLEQIALVAVAGKGRPATLGGGKVVSIREFMDEVRFDPESGLANRPFSKMVPEQYVILRSLQYAAHYWKTSLPVLTG